MRTEREQEIERLEQVHRSDREIVIPLAPVVIDLDAAQPAASGKQLHLFRRRFLGEERMTEIHHDTDVVETCFLEGAQCSRRRAERQM